MSARNIAQRGLAPACIAANVPDVTFHVLRHTYASILIAQGNDPAYVATQMGHAQPSEPSIPTPSSSTAPATLSTIVRGWMRSSGTCSPPTSVGRLSPRRAGQAVVKQLPP